MEAVQIFRHPDFVETSKGALFDLDWTLICPSNGQTWSYGAGDWNWMNDSVPETLRRLYSEGYCIVIFTNQSRRKKLDQIMEVLSSFPVPAKIYIAWEKSYHKPSTLMYDLSVDKSQSFFCGDALGRPGDFSDSDLLFGQALGIQVLQFHEVFSLETFTVQPIDVHQQTLVIMMGSPGSGKSTQASAIRFATVSYILDSDFYKSNRAKMLRSAKEFLSTGASVVIDATNPTAAHRQEYIDLANELGVGHLIVHVATDKETVLQRNALRTEKKVPKMAIYTYFKRLELPEEDCQKLFTIPSIGQEIA